MLSRVLGTGQGARLPGGLLAGGYKFMSWFKDFSRLELYSLPSFVEGVSGLAGNFALTLLHSRAVAASLLTAWKWARSLPTTLTLSDPYSCLDPMPQVSTFQTFVDPPPT